MPDPDSPDVLIAFDFGLRRIGVAVGQTITGSASPLGVVSNGANGPDFERIGALIGEWRPNILIVGQPLTADGEPSAMDPHIKAFAADLGRFQLPIELVDERFSSLEAAAQLKTARQAGSRGRIRKEHIDAAAAVMIAERYLRLPTGDPAAD